MLYFKKLNEFGRLLWVAELETISSDPDVIEISKKEYDILLSKMFIEEDELVIR